MILTSKGNFAFICLLYYIFCQKGGEIRLLGENS